MVSHLEDVQEDLDAASKLQDMHLELLRIFNAVIEQIVDVWAPFSMRTKLIWFHRYIPMQRWHWARCLVQPKYVSIFSLPISYYYSEIMCRLF
jgi:hypothetical protein